MRGRRWCFTYYMDDPERLPDRHATMDYMVYGWETCPTTKRPHLQGYVEWDQTRTMAHCQKVLPCSWRLCNGDQASNIKYCTKEGDFIEFGEKKNQGARSDLAALRAAVDVGTPELQLWQDHFSTMTRYHKGVNIYRSLLVPERNWQTIVILIVGPPGRGKTNTAFALAKGFGEPLFVIPETKGSGLYFDMYQGQPIVLLDEMDGGRMKPTLFNGLCDSKPYTVPIHGTGNVNWCPRVIIITSNYLPKYWWRKRNPTQIVQTTRRIHVLMNFTDKKVPESTLSPKKKRIKISMVDTVTIKEKLARDRKFRLWIATGDPKFYEDSFPL